MPQTPLPAHADRPARPAGSARLGPRRGFTLTELMISLVMVLLLVLAVSRIFSVTATTIGKGNATGEVIRGLDAARIALQIDFTGTDGITYGGFTDDSGLLPGPRQPSIIIYSTSIPAFMSQRDMEGDADFDPSTPLFDQQVAMTTLDADNDGVDELTFGPFQTGRRWFRTDTISFFTEGHAESQTNLRAGGGFTGDIEGHESWVWYGHGRVYDGISALNAFGSYLLPGEGTSDANPNHYFANQFVLLRNAIMLTPQVDHDQDPTTATTVVDGDGIFAAHLRPRWDTLVPDTDLYYDAGGGQWVPNLGPFTYDLGDMGSIFPGGQSPVRIHFAAPDPDPFPSPPNRPYEQGHEFVNDGSLNYVVQQSRVDIAGVDADAFRERLKVVQREDETGAFSGRINGPLEFTASPRTETWYERMFARSPGSAVTPAERVRNAFRFFTNPLVLKPLHAGEASQASAYLLGGAAQFIVEYAGDFLTQDLDGVTTANTPDGVIDYTVDADGVRHIRWYGMPRDVDNDGVIPGPAAAPADLLTSIDTRPLADYVMGGGAITVDTGFPFEKRLPAAYDPAMQTRANITDYLDPALYTANFDWSYLVAWGPGDFDGDLYGTLDASAPAGHNDPALLGAPIGPALIRVIVQGLDRESRLEEPISMELVFRVPAE